MIIDRRNNVSGKLVGSFIKLLDFDEIKLIVPSIVVHETNKHIEEQLSEVGKKIEYAIKSIDEIYGINGYTIQGLEVKQYKKNSRNELNALLESYNHSKADYLNEIQLLTQKVFNHRNCIIVPDNAELRSACLKRRIYKKAPFHHEKKESYADGLIVETLLHINDTVTINVDDEIILVTGNTSDFSDQDDKSQLHDDILNDLEQAGLKEKTQYVIRFCELVGKVLKDEVKQANLKEEFEQELSEEEESERALLDAEIDDAERESAGLTPLGNFEEEFLENFRESEFSEKVVELFERLNNCYSTLEELYLFYSDAFPTFISSIEPDEILDFIEKWNTIYQKVNGYEAEENIGGILDILDKIESKACECDFSDHVSTLPDCLEYGDNIIFYCKNKNKFELTMDPLYLSCDNGGTDWLDIKLLGHNCAIEAQGRIDITYGFIDFNDEGNVDDGCEEDISYETDSITIEIDKLVNELEQYVHCEEQKVETLREEFDP